MEMKKKGIVLTGDRPTGRLHLGHYVGSLSSRLNLQYEYNQFIMIADAQALTDNADNPEKVRSNIIEVALDYLAVGIDPDINTIFIQSQIPELAELAMYFMNLVTVTRLQRNPTVKEEMKQKGFKSSVPAGFLVYPVSQAADITAFKAELVPVGEDQLPMIEQANEIVRRFNTIYKTSALVECKALISETKRLPGVDGKSKMGKSLGNAIYLADSSEDIAMKIKGMFTDPKHLKASDPGTVEGNPVFVYLDAFDPDKTRLEEMKIHYRKGGLGDGVVKARLNVVLQEFLAPIRNRRLELEKDPAAIMAMLKRGSENASRIAKQTLKEVKEAMLLNYFE